MSSLPKGESMDTKLVELFANMVVERRNIINVYLRGGGVCIESVRRSWFRGSTDFELFLLFSWSCRFLCQLLILRLLLLLDGLLKLLVGYLSSNCASWGLGFEIQTLRFYCQWTHQGGDWETKWSIPWFDCDESLTWRGLNSNLGHFDCFTFILCFVGESRLLVSWCAGDRCDMAYNNEDRGRSRRPGAKDREWSYRLGTRWPGDREVRWRYVRSTPCMWRRGARVSWLILKTKVDGLWVVWTQNHSDGFLRFELQNRQL
jgi:hypothetical protein